jgi:hypothetical protein
MLRVSQLKKALILDWSLRRKGTTMQTDLPLPAIPNREKLIGKESVDWYRITPTSPGVAGNYLVGDGDNDPEVAYFDGKEWWGFLWSMNKCPMIYGTKIMPLFWCDWPAGPATDSSDDQQTD